MNYCTSVSMCCTAALPGAEGTSAMLRAGGFVIYLFGMVAVYFECTSTSESFFLLFGACLSFHNVLHIHNLSIAPLPLHPPPPISAQTAKELIKRYYILSFLFLLYWVFA